MPWQLLEKVAPAGATRKDWAHFPPELLQPINKLAKSPRCPEDKPCQLTIEKRQDGSFVGLCSDRDFMVCESAAINKQDLILHQLDIHKLVAKIKARMNIDYIDITEINEVRDCWHVGQHSPKRGEVFEVYFVAITKTSQG